MIQFADSGPPSLLILSVPADLSFSGTAVECFAVPILKRSGGFLLNVPRGVVSEDALIDALSGEDRDSILGPSKGFDVSLHEEDSEGNLVDIGSRANTLLIDFTDDCLAWLRDYDPQVVDDQIVGFSSEHPNALPVFAEVVEAASNWVQQQGSDRVNFYSALEEQDSVVAKADAKGVAGKKAPVVKRVTNAQVLEQMSILVSQMKALATRQDNLEQAASSSATVVPGPALGNVSGVPAVSAGLGAMSKQVGAPPVAFAKFTNLTGPPPKVKQTPNVVPPVGIPAVSSPEAPIDPGSIAQALTQQSSAVLALVSHLAGNADPLMEIPGVGGALSTSTKGVQKRERMQQDLASGSSSYYLQVMQQLHKKLHPSLPMPKSINELSHLSFLTYLERSGGFRNARDQGLLMWLLGHVLDAAAQEDWHMVRERLALTIVAVDQSVVDGSWNLGFLLSLAEDPPIAMFQDRASTLSPFGKPFSSLVPPQWASTVLAYVKEMEVLQSKKPDAVPKKTPKASPDPDSPSPKRRPRFPKKPNNEADPAKSQ